LNYLHEADRFVLGEGRSKRSKNTQERGVRESSRIGEVVERKRVGMDWIHERRALVRVRRDD
jgi:hypothetical protein